MFPSVFFGPEVGGRFSDALICLKTLMFGWKPHDMIVVSETAAETDRKQSPGGPYVVAVKGAFDSHHFST